MSGIQMALMGAGAPVIVNFTDDMVDAGSSYFQCDAAYTILNNGKVQNGINGTYTDYEQWVTPTSAASDYEVYVTLTGDALYLGTINSWVACSSSPFWDIRCTGNQIKYTTLSMQVRKTGTTTVLDTWTVQLLAESYL